MTELAESGGAVLPTHPEALAILVDLALREDVGPGDWTTLWTVPERARGSARILAKKPLVVAGTDPARRVFAAVDPGLHLSFLAEDGTEVESGGVVAEIHGSLRGILTGERVALNFLGRLSGIATLTRRFVERVEGTKARIVDTRKTTPGWRLLEKDAVRAGGGTNHRIGLHDMVLVKDNHIAAAGGLEAAVVAVRRENGRRLAVEVEVTTLHQLDEALRLSVDRILLDNMPVEEMREAVRRAAGQGATRPLLEASGNVTLSTVRAIAETGVDLISVGALTHSAPAADLSLRVDARSSVP